MELCARFKSFRRWVALAWVLGQLELLTHSDKKIIPHSPSYVRIVDEVREPSAGLDWAGNSQWAVLSLVGGLNTEALATPCSVVSTASGGCPRGHITSLHASSLQFIHHTSTHLWTATSDLLTPSDLHTQDFARTKEPTFLHDSTSACPCFQASSSHANWTPPPCSTWLSTRAGARWFSIAASEWRA